MKLHLPKQLFTALLAAIALTAPAAWGELYVETAGNFFGGSHAFTFTVTEGLLGSDNTNDVLAAYWGNYNAEGGYNVNAYVLKYANDTIYLSVGDGTMSGWGENNSIAAGTTFSSQRGNDFATTTDNVTSYIELDEGKTYLVKVTGASGDNGQSVSLYNASTGELLGTRSYNGNMNGGNEEATMSSATNASYSADGVYLWNATGSDAEFTGSNFWTTPASITGKNVFFANNKSTTYASTVNVTSATSVANMDVYGSYIFGGTGTLTVTGGLNIAADASATFNVATTLGGTVTNNGELTMSNSTLGGTVTNNGTLNLNGVLNISDLAGLERSGSYSDGDNGIFTGSFLVVTTGAEGELNLGDSFGLQLNGSALSTSTGDATYYTYDSSTVSIKINETGTQTYWINTNASYDASRMGTGKNVLVSDSGTFNSTDGSVIARTYGTGHVKLGNAGSELTVSGESNFAGNLTILSGTTVKAAGHEDALGKSYVNAAGKNRIITVENGATLDINGQDLYYHIILNEGATLANTGTEKGTSNRGTPYLELAGNATVHAASNFGMRYAGADTTTQSEILDLHGHTLTKTGAGSFFLYNTTVTSGTIDVQSGSLTSHGGTHNNTVIKLGSGTSFSTTSTTLNSSVIVGNEATFTANGGTYTETSITLEDGGIFNYRTGGNHSFKKLDTGAATISAAANANYTMTVTNASVSTGLLTKGNAGGLKYNGGVTLCKGAHVMAGTLTFNSAATISGLITVDTGATLALGANGSVTLKGLGGFELWDTTQNAAASMPTENGYAAESTTYRIINNSGTNGMTSVSYGGASYNLTDGCITVSGENRVYYVVQSGDNKVVTGGDNGVTASEFYVAESGHLVLAETVSGQTGNDYSHIAGTGKLTVTFGTSNHDNHANFGNLFVGTLEVNGQTNLTGSVMRDNVVLQLGTGEHWSSGSSIINNNIKLADNDGDFVFRNSDTLVLNGIVTGKYLNIGTTGNNTTTVELTNSQNDITHAVIGCGANTTTLKLSADMSFDSITTHTGSTVALAEGITLTLGSTEASSSTISKLHVDGTSTIHLNEKATLNQFTKSGTGTVTLTGSGKYDLGSSTSANVSGLTEATWTGTVKITEANFESGSGIPLQDLGNSASSIELSGVTAFQPNALTNKTCNSNIILNNGQQGFGLKITDGWSTNYSNGAAITFTGAISGDGKLEFVQRNANSLNQKYVFNGDISKWTGTIEHDEGGANLGVYLVFDGNASKVNAAITGGVGGLNVEARTDVAFNQNLTSLSSFEVNDGKTATVNATLSAGTVNLGTAATITGKDSGTVSMAKVKMNATGISSADTTGATKGSISNAQLTQLQADASFTIQDMTLTNTTITAASTTTRVNLSNVSASDLALEMGKFTMNAAPVVGLGGTDTNATFNTGVSSLTAGAATLTLNLDMVGAYESTGAVSGATLTITLGVSGAEFSRYTVENWQALVGFEGWLGTMLENQGATYQVADGAAQVAEGNSAPTVSYGYAAGDGGSNVGTLTITIAGLNVPEPASATLGLAALMMLCARRRRKA